MRADHCPMANEPCQSICDTPCSAHRLKIAPEADLKVYQSIVDNYHRDAAPQPTKQPLTDNEWFEFWDNCQAIPGESGFPEFLQIARAIEAAHGITGETK